MSIEQQNQIRELQRRVDLLEAAVDALLKAMNAPAIPKRETLSLKKLFNGSNG